MKELKKIRLLVDSPRPGGWNMAVDEALMKSVGGELDSVPELPVLRLYQWEQPTLSLGYFQQHADREGHLSSRAIALVRRNSGGGAIVHDHELTYSLTIPQSLVGTSSRFRESTELYSVMHETLIQALAELGIEATRIEVLQKELEGNFLCFQRRAPNDVVVRGNKVCGSAQRKKHGAISQHGSIILKTSDHAPEISGIGDLEGRELHVSQLVERWIPCIVSRLEVETELSQLAETENSESQKVQKEKFDTLAWNRRR